MFVPGDLSKKSMTFSKDMQGFLKEIPDKEREEFVESIFTVLNKSGITTTENVTISKIVKCIANISEVTSNKVTREKLGKIFNIFLKYFRS
jgi:Ca2+-binding EF-hand superfamily protein